MSENRARHEDHGIGLELIDESKFIADTTVDHDRQEKVQQAQAKGVGYWIVAVFALALLAEQSTFDYLLYNPILGQLAAAYHTSDVIWVMTTVLLGGAVTIPLFSKLADVYGKKRTLLLASVVTMVGCLVCAVAPTFPVLLAGRALMSAGAGTALFCALVVREVFPVRSRAVALALMVNGAGLMIVGGPLLGGWLVGQWGVSAPFWFQLAVCAVSTILAAALIPESPLRVRARVDYVGALLLAAGTFCLLFGLGQVPASGWTSLSVGMTLAGVVLLAVWIAQLRRVREPLINFRLLAIRPVLLPTLSKSLLNATVVAVNVLIVLLWSTPHSVAPYGRGLTPLGVAIWSIPFAVLTVGGGIAVGLTVRSIGYRTHMIVSAVCWAAVCLLLAFNLTASTGAMIAIYALGGLGSMFLTASVSLVLLASPADQRGIANGVSTSVASIFSAVGQVLVFAVVSAGVLQVVGGVAVFTAHAYQIAFLVCGAFAVLGLATALAIPHGRRQPRSEGSAALTGVPTVDAAG